MASMDFPADRPLAVPSAKAIAKPTSITWLTLALMTTASVASPLRADDGRLWAGLCIGGGHA